MRILCGLTLLFFGSLAPLSAGAQADSVDLASALALARARSPLLAAASATTQGAAGRLAVARSARWPRVSGDAVYLRFQDPPAVTLGPLGRLTPIPQTAYFLQVGVQQPVYTGGRISQTIRAAEWVERSAALSRGQVEVELTAAVAHAHDAALLARSLLGVAEEGAAVLDSAVVVAERNYAAGTVARIDVLRAETRRASAQADVRATRAALASAHEQLAVLLGIDPATAPPVSGALEPAGDTVDAAMVPALLARARATRPDIEALGAAARAAEGRAAVARATLRPTVALYFANLTTRPELVTERKKWANDWYGGVIASWPVFDFGAAAGEARAARAEADRARAEATRLGDEAAAAVLARQRDLVRATADIAAGRENVARAQRALAIAQDRYAEGAGIQLEVLEAQADLVKVRADLLGAIHAHRSAAVELRRAVGQPADASLMMSSDSRPQEE
jgi:outer membrane protein